MLLRTLLTKISICIVLAFTLTISVTPWDAAAKESTIAKNEASELGMQDQSDDAGQKTEAQSDTDKTSEIENIKYTDVADLVDLDETVDELDKDRDGELEDLSPYQTKRLIVESADVTETHGAINAYLLSGEETILEYASETETKKAYKALKDDYKCYVDQILAVDTEDTENAKENKNSGTEEDYGTLGLETLRSKNLPSEVTLAVLDSGIYSDSSYFKGGRISSASYDFVNDTSDLTKTKAESTHGTHVAGIVSQYTPGNVKILALKILNDEETVTSLLLVSSAIKYAIANGADVINMSLKMDAISDNSESGSKLNYLDDVLQYAYDQGVLVCVAAGNGNEDAEDGVNIEEEGIYPACLGSVVTVGSVEYNNKNIIKSNFSNYGDALDFVAFGKNIKSAGIEYENVEKSGTSMSTPFISACFAYLKGYYPKLSAKECINMLKNSCEDLGDAGKDSYYGWGLPDLSKIDFGNSGEGAQQENHTYRKTIVKKATCTEEGLMRYTCTDSGCSFSYEKAIAAFGHNYEPSVAKDSSGNTSSIRLRCKNCGAYAADSNGQKIDLMNGDCLKGTISDSTASGNTVDWKVKMDDMNSSGNPVCTLTISAKDGNGEIPQVDAYPWESLKDYITCICFEGDITKIPANTFQGMKYLNKNDGVILPDSLTEIGANAFAGCSSLESINLESQLNSIGNGAFVGCTRLAFTVNEDNKSFSSGKDEDYKCLYNKNQTVLYYANTKDGSFADSVTEIGPYAFYGQNITDLTLSNKITKIGEKAFAECFKLSKIYLEAVDATKVAGTSVSTGAANISDATDADIAEEAFLDVNAKVYVMKSSEFTGWKQENYGGVLTWFDWNLSSDLASVTVDKSSASAFYYTGKEICPKVKVTLKDGTVLKEGEDYSLSYSNNIEPSTSKKPALVYVIGREKANKAGKIYAGSITANFSVERRKISKGSLQIVQPVHIGDEVHLKFKDSSLKISNLEADDSVSYDVSESDGKLKLNAKGKPVAKKAGATKLIVRIKQNKYFYPGVETNNFEYKFNIKLKGSVFKSAGASYQILSKNTVAYKKGVNKTSLIIPNTVKFKGKTYRVTKISSGACKELKKIKKVTIGKNVTTIGENAFYGCKSLKTIIIRSKKLKTIGKNAFKSISSKAKVKVPLKKLKLYKKKLRKAGLKGKKQKVVKY